MKQSIISTSPAFWALAIHTRYTGRRLVYLDNTWTIPDPLIHSTSVPSLDTRWMFDDKLIKLMLDTLIP